MMSGLPKEELAKMGQSGKEYCAEHFSFKGNMDKLEQLIND
jgi:hypothetical protein